MESDYRAFIDEDAFEFLQGRGNSDQQEILQEIRKLKLNPFREGDFLSVDSKGRELVGLIVGIHAIIYWLDHSEKEIKITDIRHADR